MSEPQRSFLAVHGGPLNGKRIALEDVDEVLIGSDPGCKLRLELPAVSPIHARFWRDLGGARVYDTRSPAGLYVNDDVITGDAPVQDGDVLWLGEPGAPDSVMIQVRLFPPGVGDPQAAPLEVGAAPEFFVVDEAKPPEPDPSPIPLVAGADDFIFEMETPGGPPPVPVDVGPAAVVPTVEEFLVEEELPAVTPPPPPPKPSSAPPRPQAAVAAPVAAPPPAPPTKPSPPSPPASPTPAVPSGDDVFVVDAAAVKAAEAVNIAAASRASAPVPRTPAAQPAGARAAPPPKAPRPGAPRAKQRGRLPLVPILGAVLVAAGAGAWLTLHLKSAPELLGISPARARIGESVNISGKNFSATAAENSVSFSGKAARVVAAAATRLEVEVPSLGTTPGRDVTVEVLVRVRDRETKPGRIAVFQVPRLHALSPEVGLPGDDVTLTGSAWGGGAQVLFDTVPAEVSAVSPTTIKARVPPLQVAPGSDVKVSVVMGSEASNTMSFAVGRLPLVKGVTPAAAAPGDEVKVSGRGFQEGAEVRIGGVKALVVSAASGELRVAVPFGITSGEQALEVRVPGSDNVGEASVTLSPAPELVELRFAAERAGDDPHQAVVTTALGPAFLLATANGKRAAERAALTVQRLNDAAAAIRVSGETDFVARGFDATPSLGLVGKDEAILEATGADAALYDARSGGKNPVTPARLAVWWEAVARDLVSVLVRGEKPRRVASLSPADARPLGDLFAAAQKGNAAGIPWALVSTAKPAVLSALRGFATRVPASVQPPAGASGTAVTPVAPTGNVALPTDRVWNGFEVVEGLRRLVSVTAKGTTGSYAYTGGVGVSLPLSSVEQKRGELRFTLSTGGRLRQYVGTWDGSRLTGKISSDASGSGDLGSFELTPR